MGGEQNWHLTDEETKVWTWFAQGQEDSKETQIQIQVLSTQLLPAFLNAVWISRADTHETGNSVPDAP